LKLSGKKLSVSWQIIIRMIPYSMAIIIPLVIGYSVYEWKDYENKLNEVVVDIIQPVLPVIEEGVWTLNIQLLDEVLESLIKVDIIGYIYLEESLNTYHIIKGERTDNVQKLDVKYEDKHIATLYIGPNPEYKRKYIERKVKEIFFKEIVRSIIFCLIGFWVLNSLLIRHLKDIKQQLKDKSDVIHLDRRKKYDELCEIVAAINAFIKEKSESKRNLILQVGRIICIVDEIKEKSEGIRRIEDAVIAMRNSLELLIYVFDNFANKEQPDISTSVTVGDINRAGKDIKDGD